MEKWKTVKEEREKAKADKVAETPEEKPAEVAEEKAEETPAEETKEETPEKEPTVEEDIDVMADVGRFQRLVDKFMYWIHKTFPGMEVTRGDVEHLLRESYRRLKAEKRKADKELIKTIDGDVRLSVDEAGPNYNPLEHAKVDGALSAPSEQERKMVEVMADKMNAMGIPTSTDWEEGQRVLDMGNGEDVRMMGTTTRNRMADVDAQLKNTRMSDKQSLVVSVFTGKKNNQTVTFDREDGVPVKMNFQQGNDTNAGTKHSLYGHYGTTKGIINARDILRIPEIIEKGSRNQKGKKIEYTLKDGKTLFTVYAIAKGNSEIFQDFYSSWKEKKEKASTSEPSITQGENTQSAQSSDADASAKLQQNSDTSKEMSGKIREHRVYHGSGADFDAFDHSHMGEGEGAQVYGWGSYVTEVEGIGRTYARSYGRDGFAYKGKTTAQLTLNNPTEAAAQLVLSEMRSGDASIRSWKDAIEEAQRYASDYIDSVKEKKELAQIDLDNSVETEKYYEDAIGRMERGEEDGGNLEKYRKSLALYRDNSKRLRDKIQHADYYIELYKERINNIRQLDEADFRDGATPTLYTVEIPDDTGGNYLDYTARMGEQGDLLPKVIESLKADGWESKTIRDDCFDKGYRRAVLHRYQTGADFYAELKHAFGSDRAASQFLHDKAGLVGIKYPAEYRSGGRSDNAKNYVVFDENDLKITDKVRFFL